jgi:hypothetical protein
MISLVGSEVASAVVRKPHINTAGAERAYMPIVEG